MTYLRLKTGTITDDAFITYRYARNLVQGRGLVYNAGERVLGTTTPLYTLIMAGVILTGIAPWYASLVMDCFLVTALLWIMIQFSKLIGDKIWGWLTISLLLLNPYSMLPVAGMETALFNIFIFGAFLSSASGRNITSVILALLASLTRPEGALALMLVLPVALWDFKSGKLREGWKNIILLVLLTLLISVSALEIYYGSVIPQSVRAKQALVQQPQIWKPFFSAFFQVQFFPYGVLNLLGFLEWVGFAIMIVRFPVLRLPVGWFIFYLFFMKMGNAPDYVWYYTPIFPVRMMALSLSLVSIARMLPNLIQKALGFIIRKPLKLPHPPLARNPFLTFPLALLLLLLLGRLYVYYSLILLNGTYYNERPLLECKNYEPAGLWIKRHSQPQDEVLTPEIGYIGYFSERPIFDPIGLVSPRAAAEFGKTSMWEWAVRRHSKFVVFPFENNSFRPLPHLFIEEYRVAKTWRNRRSLTVVFERAQSKKRKLPESVPDFSAGIYPDISAEKFVVRLNPQHYNLIR